jgi:hypothetical protein
MSNLLTIYQHNILCRYRDLKNADAKMDNYELAKIFEYYTCIKLSEELDTYLI